MFYLFILAVSVIFNFIGALGPEVGFDALWYHLVIPKLYSIHGGIYHIPGGLLYYSEMPRLTEMIYLFINPHLVSWGVGIGAGILTYLVARRWLTQIGSLIAVVIFYVTPLVGWLSGSAYIDLTRTFFEVLAFYFMISKKPILAGLVLGLAISTKTLAIGSVGILGLLGIFNFGIKNTAKMTILAISIALPWFMASYLNTGYPFYPIGAGILDSRHQLNLNPGTIIPDFWKLWLAPEDVISPIYVMILPFIFGLKKKYWVLAFYSLLSFLVWWLTPQTGGGRFILPYLPVWAVLAAVIVDQKKILMMAVIVVAVFNLVYRGAAIWRLAKPDYLCQTIDFSLKTFVDCDGWTAKNIPKNALVYVEDVHNLAYVDFPFVSETWWRGEKYDYMLTDKVGEKIGWKLIHEIKPTGYVIYNRL